LVRRLRRLLCRPEPGVVLLEGPRVVQEAIDCGVRLQLLALREDVSFQVQADRVVRLDARAFASLSRTATPQGVLALTERPRASMAAALALARRSGWPLVVLDRVQDPGNVGAICRTAAAAGAPALAVLEGSADPYGPKAVRASAGHVFRLVVARGSWADLVGVTGVGAVAGRGRPWWGVDWRSVALVAFGSEAHGLGRGDLEPVTVPMAAGVESLNVAAAAAVVLFGIRGRLEAEEER
jgi:TrmH family RNA methyltransferase